MKRVAGCFALGASFVAASLGQAAQAEPETEPIALDKTCEQVLAMGYDAWFDYFTTNSDLSTSTLGMNEANWHYADCLYKRAETELDDDDPELAATLKASYEALHDLWQSQWRINGYSGGTMFSLFTSSDLVQASQVLDAAAGEEGAIPEDLRRELLGGEEPEPAPQALSAGLARLIQAVEAFPQARDEWLNDEAEYVQSWYWNMKEGRLALYEAMAKLISATETLPEPIRAQWLTVAAEGLEPDWIEQVETQDG
jgi:hypothetical protein